MTASIQLNSDPTSRCGLLAATAVVSLGAGWLGMGLLLSGSFVDGTSWLCGIAGGVSNGVD